MHNKNEYEQTLFSAVMAKKEKLRFVLPAFRHTPERNIRWAAHRAAQLAQRWYVDDCWENAPWRTDRHLDLTAPDTRDIHAIAVASMFPLQRAILWTGESIPGLYAVVRACRDRRERPNGEIVYLSPWRHVNDKRKIRYKISTNVETLNPRAPSLSLVEEYKCRYSRGWYTRDGRSVYAHKFGWDTEVWF